MHKRNSSLRRYGLYISLLLLVGCSKASSPQHNEFWSGKPIKTVSFEETSFVAGADGNRVIQFKLKSGDLRINKVAVSVELFDQTGEPIVSHEYATVDFKGKEYVDGSIPVPKNAFGFRAGSIRSLEDK